jgi:hypothetical protein
VRIFFQYVKISGTYDWDFIEMKASTIFDSSKIATDFGS